VHDTIEATMTEVRKEQADAARLDLTGECTAASPFGPLVHPHDRAHVLASLRAARQHRQDTIVRVDDGADGWVEVRCSFIPITRDTRRVANVHLGEPG